MEAEVCFLCPNCNRYSPLRRVEGPTGRIIRCIFCQAEFPEDPDLAKLIIEDAGPFPE